MSDWEWDREKYWRKIQWHGICIRYSPLTFGLASKQFLVWSPDGTKVAYWRPTAETFQKAISGTGPEELLYKDSQNRTTILNNWSSDGRYLLFGVFDPANGFGLDAVPMFGDPVLVEIQNGLKLSKLGSVRGSGSRNARSRVGAGIGSGSHPVFTWKYRTAVATEG